MSKRKSRKSAPSISQATLDRARQQLAGETPATPVEPAADTDPQEDAAASEPALPVVPAAKVTARVERARATRRRRLEPAQAKGGRKEVLDGETIKHRLNHPTRVVTEEQLRAQYSYVMSDLRTVGIIALAMIVLMVVMAQIV